MNESTDFAYTAGYIDGDGCFYIGKIKTSPFYQHTFSIISTHLDNIEWFNSKFKGSINTKKSRQENRIPSYHFVFSKLGYEDLNQIYPYIIEKKEECLIFLRFIKTIIDKDYLLTAMNILKNESNIIHESIKDSVESIRETIKPITEDFAYLAGFIDAECSLDISRTMHKRGKNPCYRAQLQCNNTKAPFFYWVSQRFGGQFHFLDKSHIENCRNQMIWRISCSSLYPILKGVYPFLKHKKAICQKMIEFSKFSYTRKGSPSPNSPQYAEFYKPILEARERIYNEVRHLNNTII